MPNVVWCATGDDSAEVTVESGKVTQAADIFVDRPNVKSIVQTIKYFTGKNTVPLLLVNISVYVL